MLETVPPVVSASGTSYVPPVLVCEAGYGSVHATDNKYKEEVISGVTSTFTSTFSSSSGVPAWREEISVNVYGGRSELRNRLLTSCNWRECALPW
jgi:hypothetical protein